jgi:hypothetical protein
MKKVTRGIICLETEWSFNKKKLKDDFTSEPLLKFLKSYYNIDYIYRRVATYSELSYYLKEFSKITFAKYGIFYFSFHGEKNCIILEGEKKDEASVDLNELADISGTAFNDKIVHFSSCRTLIGSEEPIKQFKHKTNAKIVSGYRKKVDVIQSAIHDIAYFNELQKRCKFGLVKNAMAKLYGNVEDKLGFEMY